MADEAVKPVSLAPGKRKRITLCNYGPSRSGKTELAATFPRPLFLSDAGESGWETIRYMNPAKFYEPEHKTPSELPVEVWPIASAGDMLGSLPRLQASIMKEPQRWGTIVIDSFTFYADSYFAALEMQYRTAMKDKYDSRKTYGDLASHLRWIMIRVHEITEPFGLNVVWLALDKPPSEPGDPGTILIPGQSAQKVPARCDGLLYQKFYKRGNDLVFEVHSQPFGAMPAGGRGFQNLKNPMENATYRDLETALGIMPKFNTKKAA